MSTTDQRSGMDGQAQPAPARASTARDGAEAAVQLTDVTKTFGRGSSEVVALDGVSLSVAPGEFVCLIGASGCGKSTLLSLVAGLEAPTSGTVSTGGRRVAFMFQEPALFPWLTAVQNVELPLRANGVGRAERRQRANELLDSVHLAGFAGKRPHELSGGMRQRVALARALAQDADVLLMDELLEGIWRRQGFSVLFVTHEVREAVRLGDRVVLLSSRPGRVLEDYPVEIERPRGIESSPTGERALQIKARLNEEVMRHVS